PLPFSRGERGELAERPDVAVELEVLVVLVETPLETVPQQRAKRLPPAHPVEQPEREPCSARRHVDGEEVALCARVREVSASEHCCGRCVRDRRRVYEARVVWIDDHRHVLLAGRRGDRSWSAASRPERSEERRVG